MRQADLTPNFEGRHAILLHRPHPVIEAIARQLAQIGITHTQVWPEPSAGMAGADLLFYDVDMGYDGQFPWAPGLAPVPTIALIGSEAPGRLAWAMKQGADAHLLKPVGSAGIYAALVIATGAFQARQRLGAELAGLNRQLACRQMLAEATAHLMLTRACDAATAYALLRQMAMSERLTLEAMAKRLLDQTGETGERRSRA